MDPPCDTVALRIFLILSYFRAQGSADNLCVLHALLLLPWLSDTIPDGAHENNHDLPPPSWTVSHTDSTHDTV